jgi:G patch domain-containing protein 1
MDDEDLADVAESQKIQISDAFAGLGTSEEQNTKAAALDLLIPSQGETMGVKLLKRMGWKEGQGIGPKIRRPARLDGLGGGPTASIQELYDFAPDNVPLIAWVRKLDRKGLGYEGPPKVSSLRPSSGQAGANQEGSIDSESDTGIPSQKKKGASESRKKIKEARGGLGVGVLNDTGSDEDPYEIGPRISYTRTIGGDKKKKKVSNVTKSFNPAVKSKPLLISKRVQLSKDKHGQGVPLDGFVFAEHQDALMAATNSSAKHLPPVIPATWISNRRTTLAPDQKPYSSTADAAKASTLDSKSRAELLGEKQLPGKSVFDYLTPAARERLASASGRRDLPPARSEALAGQPLTEVEKIREVLDQSTKLERDTAIAAISRGMGAGAPYADDDAKRSRYRTYLEYYAGFGGSLPTNPPGMAIGKFSHELEEFYNCARIFKPMTGLMASRFTTSSTSRLPMASDTLNPAGTMLSKPPPKLKDPAEEAAKMGMYGNLTRSAEDFYPTRLLCKRFNIKPPDHVNLDSETASMPLQPTNPPTQRIDGDSEGQSLSVDIMGSTSPAQTAAPVLTHDQRGVIVQADRNMALEGPRPDAEVFRAIFGDGSDDE